MQQMNGAASLECWNCSGCEMLQVGKEKKWVREKRKTYCDINKKKPEPKKKIYSCLNGKTFKQQKLITMFTEPRGKDASLGAIEAMTSG